MKRRGFMLPLVLVLCGALAGLCLTALSALRESREAAREEWRLARLEWAAKEGLRHFAPRARALLPFEPLASVKSRRQLKVPLPSLEGGGITVTFDLYHTGYVQDRAFGDLPPQIWPPQIWGTVGATDGEESYSVPCRITAGTVEFLPR